MGFNMSSFNMSSGSNFYTTPAQQTSKDYRQDMLDVRRKLQEQRYLLDKDNYTNSQYAQMLKEKYGLRVGKKTLDFLESSSLINDTQEGLDIFLNDPENLLPHLGLDEDLLPSNQIMNNLHAINDFRINDISLYEEDINSIDSIVNYDDYIDLKGSIEDYEQLNDDLRAGKGYTAFDTETLPMLDNLVTEIGVVDNTSILDENGNVKVITKSKKNYALGIDNENVQELTELLNRAKVDFGSLNAKEKSTIERLGLYSGDFNERFKVNSNGLFEVTSLNHGIAPNSIDMAHEGLKNLHKLGNSQSLNNENGQKVLKTLNKVIESNHKIDKKMVAYNAGYDLDVLKNTFRKAGLKLQDLDNLTVDLYSAISIAFNGDEDKLAMFLSDKKVKFEKGGKTLDQMRKSSSSNLVGHLASDDSVFLGELIGTVNSKGVPLLNHISSNVSKHKKKIHSIQKGDTLIATNSATAGPLDFTVDASGNVADYNTWSSTRNIPYKVKQVSDVSVSSLKSNFFKNELDSNNFNKVLDFYNATEESMFTSIILEDGEGNKKYIYRPKNQILFGPEQNQTGKESIFKFIQNNFEHGKFYSDDELSVFELSRKQDKARRTFEGFFNPNMAGENSGYKQAKRYYKTYNSLVRSFVINENKNNDVKIKANQVTKEQISEYLTEIKANQPRKYNKIMSNLSLPDKAVKVSDINDFNMLINVISDTNNIMSNTIKNIEKQTSFIKQNKDYIQTDILKSQHDNIVNKIFDNTKNINIIDTDFNTLKNTENISANIAANKVPVQSISELPLNQRSTVTISSPFKDDAFINLNLKSQNELTRNIKKAINANIPNNKSNNAAIKQAQLNVLKNHLANEKLIVDFEFIQGATFHDNVSKLSKHIKKTVNLKSRNTVLKNKFKFNFDGYSSVTKVDNEFGGVGVISSNVLSDSLTLSVDEIQTQVANLNDVFSTNHSGFVVPNKYAPKLSEIKTANGNSLEHLHKVLKNRAGWTDEAIDAFSKGLFNNASNGANLYPRGWLTKKINGKDNNLGFSIFFDDDNNLFLAIGDKDKHSKALLDISKTNKISDANKSLMVVQLPTMKDVNGAQVVSYKDLDKLNLKKTNTYINNKNKLIIEQSDTLTESLNAFFKTHKTALEDVANGFNDSAQRVLQKNIYSPLSEASSLNGTLNVQLNGLSKEIKIPNISDVQKGFDVSEIISEGLSFIAQSGYQSEEFDKIFSELNKLGLNKEDIIKDAQDSRITKKPKKFSIGKDSKLELNQVAYLLENALTGDKILENILNATQEQIPEYAKDNFLKVKNELLSNDYKQLTGEGNIAKGVVYVGTPHEVNIGGNLDETKRPVPTQNTKGHVIPTKVVKDHIKEKNIDDFIFVSDDIISKKEKSFIDSTIKNANLYPDEIKDALSEGYRNSLQVRGRVMTDQQIVESLNSFKKQVLSNLDTQEGKEVARRILKDAGINHELTDDYISTINKMFNRISAIASTYEQHSVGSSELFDDNLLGYSESHMERIENRDSIKLTDKQIEDMLLNKYIDQGENIVLPTGEVLGVNKRFGGNVQEVKNGKIYITPQKNAKFKLDINELRGQGNNVQRRITYKGTSHDIVYSSNETLKEYQQYLTDILNKNLEGTLSDAQADLDKVNKEIAFRENIIGKSFMPNEVSYFAKEKIADINDRVTYDGKEISIKDGYTVIGIDNGEIEAISNTYTKHVTSLKTIVGGTEKNMISTYQFDTEIEKKIGDSLFQHLFGLDINGEKVRVASITNHETFKHQSKGALYSNKLIQIASYDNGKYKDALYSKLLTGLGEDVVSSEDGSIILDVGTKKQGVSHTQVFDNVLKEMNDLILESGDINFHELLNRDDVYVNSMTRASSGEVINMQSDFKSNNEKGLKVTQKDIQNLGTIKQKEYIDNADDFEKAKDAIKSYLIADDYSEDMRVKTHVIDDNVKDLKKLHSSYAYTVGDFTNMKVEKVKGLTIKEMSFTEAFQKNISSGRDASELIDSLFENNNVDLIKVNLPEGIKVQDFLPGSPLDAQTSDLTHFYIPNIKTAILSDTNSIQYKELQNKTKNLIDTIYNSTDKMSQTQQKEALSSAFKDYHAAIYNEIAKKDGAYDLVTSKRLANSGQAKLFIIPPEIDLVLKDGSIVTDKAMQIDILSNKNELIEDINFTDSYRQEFLGDTMGIDKNGRPFFKDVAIISTEAAQDMGVDFNNIGYEFKQAPDENILSKLGLNAEELKSIGDRQLGIKVSKYKPIKGMTIRYPAFLDTSSRMVEFRVSEEIKGHQTWLTASTAKAMNGDVDGDNVSIKLFLEDAIAKQSEIVAQAQELQNVNFMTQAIEHSLKVKDSNFSLDDIKLFDVINVNEEQLRGDDEFINRYKKDYKLLQESGLSIADARKIYNENETINGVSKENIDSVINSFIEDEKNRGSNIYKPEQARAGVQSRFYKTKAVGYASNPNYIIRDIAHREALEGHISSKTFEDLLDFTNTTEESIISIKKATTTDKPHWADKYSSVMRNLGADKQEVREQSYKDIADILKNIGTDDDAVDNHIKTLQSLFEGARGSLNRQEYNSVKYKSRTVKDSEKQIQFLNELITGSDANTTAGMAVRTASRKLNQQPLNVNGKVLSEDAIYSDGNKKLQLFAEPIGRDKETAKLTLTFNELNEQGEIIGQRKLYGATYNDLQDRLNAESITDITKQSPVEDLKQRIVNVQSKEEFERLESLMSMDSADTSNGARLNEVIKEYNKHIVEAENPNPVADMHSIIGDFVDEVDLMQTKGVVSKDESANMIRAFNQQIKDKAKKMPKKKYKNISNEILNDIKKSIVDNHTSFTVHNGDYEGMLSDIATRTDKLKVNTTELINDLESIKKADVNALKNTINTTSAQLVDDFNSLESSAIDTISDISSLIDDKFTTKAIDKVERYNQASINKANLVMGQMYNHMDDTVKDYLNFTHIDDIKAMSQADAFDALTESTVAYGNNVNVKFKHLSLNDINEILNHDIANVSNVNKEAFLDTQNKLNLYLESLKDNNIEIPTVSNISNVNSIKTLEELNISKPTINDIIKEHIDDINEIKLEKSTINSEATESIVKNISDLASSQNNKWALAGLSVAAFALGATAMQSKPIVPESRGGHDGETPRADGTYDTKKRKAVNPNSGFNKSVYVEKNGINVNVSGTAPYGFTKGQAKSIAINTGINGTANINFNDLRQPISDDWFEEKFESML